MTRPGCSRRRWDPLAPFLLVAALAWVGAQLLGGALQAAPRLARALGPTLVVAEDEPKGEDAKDGEIEEGKAEDADENPLEACADAKAKLLAAELTKIRKKKNATVVLPVLEKIEDLQNVAFEKPLLKMLKHPSSLVALKVADMWEWRNRKKVARKLWAATFGDRKTNKRRYAVKAKVLKSWPRAGLVLTDKQFKEVESDWRWIVGNPNPALAPALVAIAGYVEVAKDKRLFRKLAEELDDPAKKANMSDPNNPSQAWWEQRWKLWKETRPAAVAALKALTGKAFDKTSEAKAWVAANGKAHGIDW